MIDPDSVKIAVAIQHTPARDDDPVFRALCEQLAAEGLDCEVVTDPEPEASYTATWRTYRSCLERTPQWATHRLVLQDDVALCDDFGAGLELAIQSRPDYLLSFFISHYPPNGAIAHLQACERGEAWSALNPHEWIPAQALCWPVWQIPPMLRHARKLNLPPPHNADDQYIGSFIRSLRLPALQSCPSLVDHVHAESTTLDPGINRVSAERRALCWLAPGRGFSPARDVAWPTGVV